MLPIRSPLVAVPVMMNRDNRDIEMSRFGIRYTFEHYTVPALCANAHSWTW